jgi:hypothetical protein
MTIGALSRETGLSRDTLRVWQRRYGFPVPIRKPSGHRLYSPADLNRLRQVSEALSRGYRPSEVIHLGGRHLQALLAQERSFDVATSAPSEVLFEHARLGRDFELIRGLLGEAAALGPLDFLRQLLMPLIERVGQARADGEMSVREEAAFFRCAESALRSLRASYERTATGPGILLATFSGEPHRLGLQMAALVAGIARLRPQVLETDLSVPEIAFAREDRDAAAVVISVSPGPGVSVRRQLVELRLLVPDPVPVVVGGRGAPLSDPPPGVTPIAELEDFHGWLRRLGARGEVRA